MTEEKKKKKKKEVLAYLPCTYVKVWRASQINLKRENKKKKENQMKPWAPEHEFKSSDQYDLIAEPTFWPDSFFQNKGQQCWFFFLIKKEEEEENLLNSRFYTCIRYWCSNCMHLSLWRFPFYTSDFFILFFILFLKYVIFQCSMIYMLEYFSC